MSQPAPALSPQVAFPKSPEEFWEKYNGRLEFPLSTVAAVFLHAVVGAVLICFLVAMTGRKEDRTSPALQVVAVTGLDDTGAGSPGSGGPQIADLSQKVDPFPNFPALTPPDKLPDPKEAPTPTPLKDPGQKLPLPPLAPAPVGPRGTGEQPGKGTGGEGADSTRARGMRWVLRFKVENGKDYVNQLKAMGAEVFFPLNDKKYLLIRDLNNPGGQREATEADFKRLAGMVQFSDNRREMVREMLAALEVKADPTPATFSAFFPKEVEDELARKETSYRNRRSEDIEETIFRVTMRGGKYEILVEDQVRKK